MHRTLWYNNIEDFKPEIGMTVRAAKDQVISSKEEEMWLSYHPKPPALRWISLSNP
jgi:hypothetical protein